MRNYLLSVSTVCLFSMLSVTRGGAAEETKKHPVEAKVDALMEKAVSTADMIQAYDKGIALWDAELNRVYQALR